MDDKDSHISSYETQDFEEMGLDKLQIHRGNDYSLKYKPDKCDSSENIDRLMTSTWYGELNGRDKDTRGPQEDCDRDSQHEASMKSVEMVQRRDLPPFDLFEQRNWITTSTETKVAASNDDPKKRHIPGLTEERHIRLKKQRVSPAFPVEDDKGFNVEPLHGYSALSILQSWSSGTIMSDKEDIADAAQESCLTHQAYENWPPVPPKDFLRSQPLPYSGPSSPQDTSRKLKHGYPNWCQPAAYNFPTQNNGDGKYPRPYSGNNLQQLLHEDRVKNFIGDHPNRSGHFKGWDSDRHKWKPRQVHNPVPHTLQTVQPWDRDHHHHPYPQALPYSSVEPRCTKAVVPFQQGYHPPMFAMAPREQLFILALPEDRASLSEVLCLVRENIEVFAATQDDIAAPAPGRKRPVFEGQVGLRCVHCRWTANQFERVKRAVCYPSSLQRIYRTIIDMKLDHFKACKYVPLHLKMKLDELMCNESRSTGTTMQYMVWAARKLGIVDSEHGIRFSSSNVDMTNYSSMTTVQTSAAHSAAQPDQLMKRDKATQPSTLFKKAILKEKRPTDASGPVAVNENTASKSSYDYEEISLLGKPCLIQDVSFSLSMDFSFEDGAEKEKLDDLKASKTVDTNAPLGVIFHGKVVLALPEDKAALTPLRCFLRQNVCAFSATSDDVVDRSATTLVTEGQVGIACLHCMQLPSKDRSNRSMCFPFTISRIYQAVADIQRFHLTECKMVPQEAKEKFSEYQSLSSKGSKGLATRQYWITSAKMLGLVDTAQGIRFSRDPSIPVNQETGLDSEVDESELSPLVLPEDKDTIAEFLYLTMLQLRPCRFKEADRNKRRLKDVGCKGVECRHCAGLVDGRKFFWSSVNAVESNFVSVHTHMIECKLVPQSLKDELVRLKALRKEQTSRLKNGSQKAFFLRVWQRLHPEGTNDIPSSPPSPVRYTSHSNEGRFMFMPRVTPSQVTVYDNIHHSMSPASHHFSHPYNRFRFHSNVYDLSVPRIEADDVIDSVE